MNPEVISKEIIKPSHPTPIHLRFLKTSLFDHVNIPVLMPLIFFYSKQKTHSTTTVLNRLKNSLPATLSVFYPLAGRVKDTSCIDCNDAGVPYVQTKVSSVCLSNVIHNADVSLLDELLPSHGNDRGGYSKLLLTIQVNTFACGGVAIGVKASHAICDGFSLAMFVKTWASIACGETQLLIHTPFFEMSRRFPPRLTQLDDGSTPTIEEQPDPDLIKSKPITKWFMFTKEMCNALRSKICADYNSNQKQPSLTMVLSAYIWSRVQLACRNDGDKSIPQKVFHAVNIRPKVEPPSKSCYYFGNMIVNAIAEPISRDHNKSICNSFVETMGRSIETINKSGFIEDLQNGKEDLKFMIEHFERLSRGELASFGFTSLKNLPIYEADFGWGKSAWVTSATLAINDLVILIPGDASSEAIFAYVNLSPDQMAKLQADQEFLSFVSKSANLGTFLRSKI